jgi:4-amino-4-deoxy-L-arabinose transferase-like glycosyltransferase
MTPRRALWGLIVVSGLLRLAWAASLGPGNDEAYHYLFTVHRDWSYFDHPPMLAVVESLGIALAGGTVSTFTLRLGFVLLFAGSTWLMARLTSRFYGDTAGLLAAFALNVTAYYSAAAGAFALPDGPLLFFWLLTLDRLAVALGVTAGATRTAAALVGFWAWVGVGLAWGGALLSKYHAVFLPAGVLVYLAVEPSARRWLRRPGPYVAAAIGLAMFAPVIGWNATHGWASFAFQGGRALGSSRLRVDTLVAALILPALYLFPWIWARLVGVLFERGRRLFDPDTPPADRFLLSQSLLPLATFLAVACTRPVLPHWTLVGFLPLFPLVGRAWSPGCIADPARFRRRMFWLALLPILIAAATVFEARTGFLQKGRPGGLGLIRANQDPTADMVGWETIAAELRTRRLLDQPGTFLFTSSWYQSGQIAFAVRDSRTPVLCYHAWDARSFAFWSRPDEWIGRDGILVALNDQADDPQRFRPWFTRIEPISAFEVVRSGAPLRKVKLYRCVAQTRAFPFDDLGRTIHPKGQESPSQVAVGTPKQVASPVR